MEWYTALLRTKKAARFRAAFDLAITRDYQLTTLSASNTILTIWL